MNLGRVVILTMLIFLIQECGISFHLLVFSVFSLVSYSFLSAGLLPQLYLFLDIFILFDALINGIVFLISLPDSLLLVHRNTTDFCIINFMSYTV